MKQFSILTFLLVSFFAEGYLAQAAPALTQIDVTCEEPFFEIKFTMTGTLSESRPEDHIELYVFEGQMEYSDRRGSQLEFKHLPVHGTFDNSRGVTRVWIRPRVPLMFGVFSGIYLTHFRDGHQLFNIESANQDGPNFGGSGSRCSVVAR